MAAPVGHLTIKFNGIKFNSLGLLFKETQACLNVEHAICFHTLGFFRNLTRPSTRRPTIFKQNKGKKKEKRKRGDHSQEPFPTRIVVLVSTSIPLLSDVCQCLITVTNISKAEVTTVLKMMLPELATSFQRQKGDIFGFRWRLKPFC